MSVFKRLFGSTQTNDPIAWRLYGAAVSQAREPVFYRDLGVPDSLDGRFELISLHVFLLLHRLKTEAGDSTELGQNVFDAMFSDMDRGLREMGSGDLGVAPRVKKMARGFYGRVSAYEAGMAPDREPGTLRAAIRRNVYGTVNAPSAENVGVLRDYMLRVAEHLGRQPMDAFEQGHVDFGAPPQPPETTSAAQAH
jgi:cytochrome b pre-mRNA-processing protein 3